MQTLKLWLLYVEGTIVKVTASGTASTTDSTQITIISTAVTVGRPVPCTRDQDATARYLEVRWNSLKNTSSVNVHEKYLFHKC